MVMPISLLHRLFITLSTLFILCFSNSLLAASLSADVDTKQLNEGDSLTLTVTTNERAFSKEPDFSPLEENFSIVNRYESSQVSMNNGQMSSSVSWRLTLIPKKTGYLVIPPLTLNGATTQPITVQVSKQTAAAKKTGKESVFIEATVDKKTAYVQEQVILKLRLYKRTQIIDASWPPPQIPDAVLETLSEARTYQTTVGNHSYNVTEYTFAVFPQKSGKIVIPATQMIATIGGTRSRGGFFFDPYASSKKVSRSSQPITLTVKPIPSTYPKNERWLPSPSVALGERWSQTQPTFKVGESITRTVILQAKGLTGTTLPDVPLPSGDSFKVYPDKTDTRSNVDADGSLSQRIASYAFIPTKAGNVTLPEINVTWWNTTTDELQVATLAARDITIEPSASGGQTQPRTTPAPSTLEPQAAPANIPTLDQPVVVESNSAWKWIALTSALLWLITSALLIWFFKFKKPSLTSAPTLPASTSRLLSSRKAKKALQNACEANDIKESSKLVLQWYNGFSEHKKHSLGELKQDCNDTELQRCITEMEACLYRHSDIQAWNGNALWQAVEQYENEINKMLEQQEALEPLHRS